MYLTWNTNNPLIICSFYLWEWTQKWRQPSKNNHKEKIRRIFIRVYQRTRQLKAASNFEPDSRDVQNNDCQSESWLNAVVHVLGLPMQDMSLTLDKAIFILIVDWSYPAPADDLERHYNLHTTFYGTSADTGTSALYPKRIKTGIFSLI